MATGWNGSEYEIADVVNKENLQTKIKNNVISKRDSKVTIKKKYWTFV